MKRALDSTVEDANGVQPPTKRIHTMAEETALKEMDAQQKTLDGLDSECAKEQMIIQQKYDEKKKPIFVERQTLIEKIPGFWGQAIVTACEMHREPYHEEDAKILQHLEKVELDDNLDSNGSYKLTFSFSDAVKEWFEPTVISKCVKFMKHEGDEGEYQETCDEATEPKWKEGKKPQPNKPTTTENKDDNSDDEDDFYECSLLEWFTTDKSSPVANGDFGEMIRRQVFHRPHDFYKFAGAEDEDDDEEIDEEEEGKDSK